MPKDPVEEILDAIKLIKPSELSELIMGPESQSAEAAKFNNAFENQFSDWSQ